MASPSLGGRVGLNAVIACVRVAMSFSVYPAVRVLFALLLGAVLLGSVGRAGAAAPEYIWLSIDDDSWFLFSDFDRNGLLLLGDEATEAPDESRPRYILHLYWGSSFRDNPVSNQRVIDRDLTVANQTGYLYPAYGAEPAVLTLQPVPFDSAAPPPRVLTPDALAMLEELGIATSVEPEGGLGRSELAVGAAAIVAIGAGIAVGAAWVRHRRRRPARAIKPPAVAPTTA